MKKVKITLSEGIKWLVEKLEEHAMGAIPDGEKLDILTTRMEGEVRDKRAAYQAALALVVTLEDPEHPNEGELPMLRAKLARREAQGADWGKELAGGVAAARAEQLRKLLEKCDSDCSQLERQIDSSTGILSTRKETCALRKTAYDAARKDLQRLKDVAPTILAQTQALDDAARERLAAMADSGKSAGSQAGSLINQLTEDLERARAGHSATEIMVADEADEDPDLDAIADKEEAARSSSDRIARWMGKTAAPVEAN